MTSDSGLTPEAKAEIAAAIKIVKEDKLEKFLRARLPDPANPVPPTPSPTPPPPTPPNPTPPPNPPSPTPPPPAPDPPTNDPPAVTRRSVYWGDLPD